MPVSQTLADDLAGNVALIYREAEHALLKIITERLGRGLDDRDDWAIQRLADVQALRRAAAGVVARLERDGTGAVREAVIAAYRASSATAVADLADAYGGRFRGNNRTARRRARRAARADPESAVRVQVLADAAVAEARKAHSMILPAVASVYRAAIAGATARHLAGGVDRREAAQSAYAALVNRGLTSYTDTRGRRWRLSTYVEMATRTAASRAIAQALIDQAQAAGRRLVYVTDRPGECVLCRPWEHKVLALSGPVGTVTEPSSRTGRPLRVHVAGTVEEAFAAGLMHPNCRHELRLYSPGLTRLRSTGTADPAGDRARQRQRSLERHVRRWKERRDAALTPEARIQAATRIRGWEDTLATHTRESGLRRLRWREDIGVGHVPPPARAGDEVTLLGPLSPGAPFPAARRPLNIVPAEQAGERALTDLSDDELGDLFAALSEAGDEARLWEVFEEMGRREAEPAVVEDPEPARADAWLDPGAEDWPEHWQAEQTPEDVALDGLLAAGWDYLDAYAEVHHLDADTLRREQAAGLVDRRAGERTEHAVRRQYDEWVHLQYLQAEDATRGHMLSPSGQAAGIDPVRLFSGPAARARRHASEDLLRWWAEHGRLTYQEFRAQVLGRDEDVRAARDARGRGNGRDFI